MELAINNRQSESALTDLIPREEATLVSATLAGQPSAFTELCGRSSARLFRALFQITKNREDAEDALQDAMLKAFLHLENFDGRSTFATWFHRIGINSALMILRKKGQRRETSVDGGGEHEDAWSQWEIPDQTAGPEEQLFTSERASRVRAAVRGLPMQYRELVELRSLRERSIKEVALAMRISEAAVKSRLYRARTMLQTSLS